ncbi:hypothetical protein AB833_26415 [Chromatiales bacterium (ex Bugula neritina AB1)]|nr:hypothetical protein AB833_26415 [Chromatiales bacterium (ex Bugula neritina AB1)]
MARFVHFTQGRLELPGPGYIRICVKIKSRYATRVVSVAGFTLATSILSVATATPLARGNTATCDTALVGSGAPGRVRAVNTSRDCNHRIQAIYSQITGFSRLNTRQTLKEPTAQSSKRSAIPAADPAATGQSAEIHDATADIKGAVTIDGHSGGWPVHHSPDAIATDKATKAKKPGKVPASITHNNSDLFIARSNTDMLTMRDQTFYLGTNTQGNRGYHQDLPIQANYLIQTDSLYRYNGNGYSWNWTYISSLNKSIEGTTIEFRIPLKHLDYPFNIQLLFFDASPARAMTSSMHSNVPQQTFLDPVCYHLRPGGVSCTPHLQQ